MFIIALFLSPLFLMIPAPATAPALVLVGLFMLEPIKELDLSDFSEAIPAFITLITMPITYSIADGIAFGMITYVIIKVATGKLKEISIATYIISALFLLKFFIH